MVINGVDVVATIGMVGIGFVMGFLAAAVLFLMKEDDGNESDND